MAFMTNPGALFIGGLRADEKKYIKGLLRNAKQSGYDTIVEPCAGTFAMLQIAAEAGFDPKKMQASDVCLTSAVLGYSIMEKDMTDLGIKHPLLKDGVTDNYAEVFFTQLYLMRAMQDGGSAYGYELLRDLKRRKEEYIEEFQQCIDRSKELLEGMTYTSEDMMKHIDRMADQEGTIILANPPVYKGGYEKFFGDALDWNEPSYELVETDIVEEILRRYKDSKALIVCYTEKPNTENVPNALFKRAVVRTGWCGYLVSNRPNEAEILAGGKYVIPISGAGELKSLNAELLPTDYEVTDCSTIRVVPVDAPVAQYYRKLWTHGFVGSRAAQNYMILVDDYITAVFGLDKSALTMGAYGGSVDSEVFIMYTMAVQHKFHRLNRLNVRITKNKEFIMAICNDLERQRVDGIKTVQMTKHPDSQGVRGLMTKTNTVKDPRYGYKLTYTAKLEDISIQEALMEWLKDERKYRKRLRDEEKRKARLAKKKAKKEEN